MASVGSTAKVESIDLHAVVGAVPSFARPAPHATPHLQAPEQDTQISAAGKLKSATSAVLDAAARLARAQTWSATKATSSDPSALEVSAQRAQSGSHTVVVDALAQAQTTASATFSSLSTVIGLGTLNIELGSWNASQTAFATNPNWPKASVTLGPKDTSLERIRDKINAAGIGVIASVVSDATGSRLVLRSTATGASNGFKVSAEPDAGQSNAAAQSLAALGFDPSRIKGGEGMSLQQAAQDAQVRIDERSLSAPQNLIEDPVTELSLGLKAAGPTPVSVQIEPDPQAIAKDVTSLAQAYNDMASQLSSDEAQADGPTAQAARDIQRSMTAAFSPDTGSAAAPLASGLNAVGVQLDAQGRLQVDEARLMQALSRAPDQVAPLFASIDASRPSQPGLAGQLLATQAAQAPEANTPDADAASPGEPPASATPASATPASATPANGSQTTAGALYRQKLLEQYAPVRDAANEASGTPRHEDDLAMLANDA